MQRQFRLVVPVLHIIKVLANCDVTVGLYTAFKWCKIASPAGLQFTCLMLVNDGTAGLLLSLVLHPSVPRALNDCSFDLWSFAGCAVQIAWSTLHSGTLNMHKLEFTDFTGFCVGPLSHLRECLDSLLDSWTPFIMGYILADNGQRDTVLHHA